MAPTRKSKRGSHKKAKVLASPAEIKSLLRISAQAEVPDRGKKVLAMAKMYKTVFDGNVPYRLRQVYDAGMSAQISLVNTYNAFAFQLSNLDNVASLASLFDQYRLDLVVLRCRPIYTESIPQASTMMPRLYSVIDYDDSNLPTSLATLREYSSIVETSPCREVSRIVVPRLAAEVYQTGGFGGYGNARMWVDVASPNVQWYGVKTAIEGGLNSQTLFQTYTFEVEAYWSFRQLR